MTDIHDGAPHRAKQIIKLAAVAIVGALLAVGLLTLRDRPVKANFSAAEVPQANVTATTPAAARTPLSGRGAPITVSGTSPTSGAPTRLADLRGTPVVMVIWASWCPGCNSEAPHLQRVAASRRDVRFFGINYRDSPADARDFVRKYGWTLPSVEDRSGSISQGLGLQGTPTTLFLDAQHREIGRVVGPMDEAGLREAIDEVVGL